MSVIGLDVGNLTSVVALARRKGIDVVLNSQSGRETPSMVNFADKQRFIGCAAGEKMSMSPKNTITQLKRIVGKKFSDPELQADLGLLNYAVHEGPGGEPAMTVNYMGEQRTFTPVEILGMLLGDLKNIAESDQGAKISDVVIGVPVFYTDVQRRAVLDASAIAGLNCLRIMPETTAVALSYGIYKTDLPEDKPLNVAFIDVGHSALQCSVVAFKKGQLTVLATGYDRNFGGANFDDVLYQHLCEEFKEKYKLDVKSNPRATLRLRVAVEKAKKVLSTNPETPLAVECLMNDVDVKSHLTRELMESLASPLLDRAIEPMKAALAEAGLTPADISSCELVGGSSRLPFLAAKLTEFFGKEPSRTLNATESVARGCALQGAMLSPTFRVRDFEVVDAFPYPIDFMWQAAPDDENATGGVCSSNVFTKNNPVPNTKLLTFYRNDTFSVDCCYADPSLLPPGTKPQIGSFTVGPLPAAKDPATKPKVKVKIQLNLHGLVSVEGAQMVEEEEPEAPKEEESAKMETDAEKADGEAKEGDKPKEEEKPKKKKLKKTDIPVTSSVGGLSAPDLEKAKESEFEMALQDRVMEETKMKKNDVEEYIYSFRGKLCDAYQPFATESEASTLSSKLDQTEDWLYEDGEDETKGVYIAKLEELKKLGDPIEMRYKEESSRGPAAATLKQTASSFLGMLEDARYEHIEAEEKEKVNKECTAALAWLSEKEAQQAALAKNVDPALLTNDITKKSDMLERFCSPIMSKPKPKPKPEEPKPEELKPEAAAEGGEPMDTSAEGAAAEGEAPPAADAGPTPMQADLD